MADYFEVFSENFDNIGIVDVYDELVWERRFYEAGYAEIHAPATANNLRMLDIGRVLYKNGAKESMLITALNPAESDGSTTITAYGRFLSFLLKKHIVNGLYELGGNVQDVMRTLVSTVVMNSASEDYIPEFRLGEKTDVKATFSGTVGYGDLHDILTNMAKQTGTGFAIEFNPENHLLYFTCTEGKDRSVDQVENPQVVFSKEYDNITSSADLMIDTTEEVNAVTVRYKGEFGELIINYNPQHKTGREKKEILLSGEPVTYTTEDGQTKMNVAATKAKFLQMAKDSITAISRRFTCNINDNGYKGEYDLGDVITIFKPEWGISRNMRIEKITENATGAGYSLIPAFCEPFPAE